MATTKVRDLNSYKYMYIVNLHLQEGQAFPTFTPVPRDVDTFPRISGQTMSDMALFYTDEMVADRNIGAATEQVLRGGPNIVRPDADDTALMETLRKDGRYSEDAFVRAAAASEELKAVLAADGQFRFNIL